MPHNSLFSQIGALFGKTPDDSAVQEFIGSWESKPRLKKDPPFRVEYPCKELRYELSFNRESEDEDYALDCVLLEPGKFKGELLDGIEWSSGQSTVRQVLGDPDYTHPELGFDLFDLDDFTIRFEYGGKKGSLSLVVLHGRGEGRPEED